MKVTVCDRNVVINMSVKLIKKERVAESFLLLCYFQTNLSKAFDSCYSALNFAQNGEVFLDQALPIGFRSAPKLFSATTDLVAWVLYQHGVVYQLCCTFCMSWRSCGKKGQPDYWSPLASTYLIHRFVSRNLSTVRQQWEELRCLQGTLCALKVHLLPPFSS